MARLNLGRFEAIDWDSDDDEEGNLIHCLRHGIDEIVVDEVISEDPIDLKMEPKTAEFAIVGPNRERNMMWTLLFDVSDKRGDWLRPVTGWRSEISEIREWEQAMKKKWRRR